MARAAPDVAGQILRRERARPRSARPNCQIVADQDLMIMIKSLITKSCRVSYHQAWCLSVQVRKRVGYELRQELSDLKLVNLEGVMEQFD